MNRVSAIILAAGRGERAGFNKNKLLAPLYGAPAIFSTFEKFALPAIDEVVIAAAESDADEIKLIANPFGYKVVTGGKTRGESVKNALEHISGDVVLIHDGARPFVTEKVICGCIESVKKYGSGICAVKCTDTAVISDGENLNYPDRENVFLLQTPQGFFSKDIKKAYSLAGGETFTDDSSLYARYIKTPHLCEGDPKNVKLTYRNDFMREYPAVSVCGRTGFGVDVHSFCKGNFITLCGVKIPCDGALKAHSDGDVAVHALMDALLSACGLKDIGHYFPNNDERYRGADSMELLKEVTFVIGGKGFKAVNASISVQAEKPKLAPYIDEMKENIKSALGLDCESVSVGAGTCEGLGFVGKGLGIAAYCAVSVQKKD